MAGGRPSLQHPDWSPIFDYDPVQAVKSRKAILDRVATDRIMVMGYHFPFPAITTGKLRTGSGSGRMPSLRI
jgi:hypothetical protein